MSVLYLFEAGTGRTMQDTAGRYALRVAVAEGGAVTFPRHGSGWSVRFPARCEDRSGHCPRAILESTRTDVFNPGSRLFRYGASILMTAEDTASGANVLQKGYSTDGGTQYKLQVDGEGGRPSCVLAVGRTIYRIMSPVAVADNHWHTVTCARSRSVLTISVDGATSSRRIPAGLSIVNGRPLRIGGKGLTANNDQFAGQLDTVFVSIS